MQNLRKLLLLMPILSGSLAGCGPSIEVIDLRPEWVAKYLSLKDEKKQADYLAYSGTYRKSYQNSLMYFDELDYHDGPFVATFATDKGFTKEVQYYKLWGTMLEGYTALKVNKTYYMKLENPDGEIVYEKKFKTKNTPGAPISIGGEGNNIRDMGGWKTTSGKHVKYGMIYRGDRINYDEDNYCTSEAEVVLKDFLGLKTEIDLRWSSDDYGQDHCAWHGGNYIKNPLYQYTFFVPDDERIVDRRREYYPQSVDSLKNLFAALSDESNYPIYAHCNAGADRTGTFGYLVNGLLGVSYEDLTKDFELTTFSIHGLRARSEIEYDFDNDDYFFNDSGVAQDGNGNYVAWGLMDQYLKLLYGDGKNNTQYAIEKFLTTYVGVSKEQINKIKKIMLE